jgi:trans-aconitate methyltransferase
MTTHTVPPKQPRNPNLTDKIYWHGYIPFYEKFFSQRNFSNIAEFGVYKGNSIRWLLERFPQSLIYGADILPLQSEWPFDPRFHFTQLNQESREEIRRFLGHCKFDLIIEDGSHQPQHQINCLVEGLDALSPGGIYILEDIQTSRTDHYWWTTDISKPHWWKFEKMRQYKSIKKSLLPGNALHTLLGIDHCKRINIDVNDDIATKLANNSLLSKAEILKLASQINSIHLYRRTHLPDYCANCGSDMYDFNKLKCLCGQPIFADADSMSFVIIKN